MNSNRFKQFTYPSVLDNMKKYKQLTAPDYPIEDITSNNIVLVYGDNDFLSDYKDIMRLVNDMKGNSDIFLRN